MCPPRCAVYTHVASSFSFTHSQLKSTTHLFIPQFIPILCKFGHRLACILYHVPNCWWLVWMFKFVSFVLLLLSPPSLQLVCLSEWTFDVLYFRHSHSLRSLLDVWEEANGRHGVLIKTWHETKCQCLETLSIEWQNFYDCFRLLLLAATFNDWRAQLQSAEMSKFYIDVPCDQFEPVSNLTFIYMIRSYNDDIVKRKEREREREKKNRPNLPD